MRTRIITGLIITVVIVIFAFMIPTVVKVDMLDYIQTLVAVVELPIIIFGFYQLRSELREREKRPNLELGLFQFNVTYQDIFKTQSPTTNFKPICKREPSNQCRYDLRLALFNRGEKSVRFIKVRFMQHKHHQDLTINYVLENFVTRGEMNTTTFEGGDDIILYANDLRLFSIKMGLRTIAESLKDTMQVLIDCEIYADGLEAPYRETLTIDLSDAIDVVR